ncbi:nuclear transport factor 2 family protein [Micromonospora sp. WMMD980]|uniref:nuclear transport factor 2 family protein n=1 Tax=Micromonospora sp. WMMD980 TaxID=3016088 RepID=UPI002416F02C|nr:nuclear transport factor 2 family protein [Micromonospora sp. WMMD980]MDG4799294.1 nuclear transport factor 2 family protein [Micromonospora sp. WMMD980]
MVDTRDAADRWASVWAQGWPAKDTDGLVGLLAEDGVHWASMFRPYRGRAGLRDYLRECFDEETRPAEVWFDEARVDGDTAAVEYWAVTYPNGQALTISGCTLLRFDRAGLVTEARDYSHVSTGRTPPPAGLIR